MAPELMRRESVSEEVDVFGFFVTMWELFTGDVPWADQDWKTIFNEVRGSCIASVSEEIDVFGFVTV